MRLVATLTSLATRSSIGQLLRENGVAFAVLLIGPLIAFGLAFRFLLTHFYTGAYLLDGGIFSELVWRNVPLTSLHTPNSGTYYSVHITPLLSLLSVVSYAVPWNRIGYFSAFIAAISFAGALLFGLLILRANAKVTERLLATIVAGLFALSGVMVEPVLYPHYEHLMAVSAVAFTACLLLERMPRLRVALFLITLLVREDGGLHLGLLLGCLILAKAAFRNVPVGYRTLLIYLAISLSASGVMLLIHRYAVPKSFSAFDGAFANNSGAYWRILETGELGRRLDSFLRERTWLYFPAAIAAFYALLFRDGGYLIGYVSNIPWFLLLIFADYDISSSFGLYYPFPFIIGHLWVLVWAFHRGVSQTIALITGLALNLVSYPSSALPRLFERSLYSLQITRTERFVRVLTKQLGKASSTIIVDSSVAALIPNVVPPKRIITGDNRTPKDADVVVFSGCYRDDREWVQQFIATHSLGYVARVVGTDFYIAAASSRISRGWRLPLSWDLYKEYKSSVHCWSAAQN